MMVHFKYLLISILPIFITISSACATENEAEEIAVKKTFSMILRHINETQDTEIKEKVYAEVRIKGNIQWNVNGTDKLITLELADINRTFSLPKAEKAAPELKPFSTSIKMIHHPESQPLVNMTIISGQSGLENIKQSQYMLTYMILDMLLESGNYVIEQPSPAGMGVLKMIPHGEIEIEGSKINSKRLLNFSQKTTFDILPDIKDADLRGLHIFSDTGNNYYYRYKQPETNIVNHAINFEAVPADAEDNYLELIGKTKETKLFQYLDYSELVLQN